MMLEARGRKESEVWRTENRVECGDRSGGGVGRGLEMKLMLGESGGNEQARSQAVTGNLGESSRIGIEWTWRGGSTVWVALLEGRMWPWARTSTVRWYSRVVVVSEEQLGGR